MSDLTKDDFDMVKLYERNFQVTAPTGMWIAVYEMLCSEVMHPHHAAGEPNVYKILLSNMAYKIYGYFPEKIRETLKAKPAKLPTTQ